MPPLAIFAGQELVAQLLSVQTRQLADYDVVVMWCDGDVV